MATQPPFPFGKQNGQQPHPAQVAQVADLGALGRRAQDEAKAREAILASKIVIWPVMSWAQRVDSQLMHANNALNEAINRNAMGDTAGAALALQQSNIHTGIANVASRMLEAEASWGITREGLAYSEAQYELSRKVMLGEVNPMTLEPIEPPTEGAEQLVETPVEGMAPVERMAPDSIGLES